jgi:hypothetical protein
MANARLWIVTHLFAAGAGFIVAPREEPLESEVKHEGFFEVDTKRVLAAAVESLRAEGALQAYSYKGFAVVSVERDGILWLDARQDLIVPAAVSYLVDLSALKATFDPEGRVVTVDLPPLTLSDVAFEPEGARTLNGGLLTFSQAHVDELTKLNYASARKAFVKQAQGATLIEAARRQAAVNVVNALELPLRVAGRPDVKVVAHFIGG